MATTPREQREIKERFAELRQDVHIRKACEIIAGETGWHWATIRKIVLKNEAKGPKVPAVEPIASEDFELRQPEMPVLRTHRVFVDKRTLEMVASDLHFPYEDRAAYALFLNVATDVQPDVLVLLGDIMDAYPVSSHDKDPNRATPAAFNDELLYTRTRLGELRSALPDARIFYKEGNHETRLSRYIRKNAAAISNLKETKLNVLLGLDDLNIEWVTNDERLRIGKLWHIHGNEVAGGGASPARLKYSRMQCNFIFGHLHQRDKYRPRAYDGQQHGAYGNPCLCGLEPEYMHHTHSWSHGFTLIDHDADGTFQVEETEVIKPFVSARTAKCNVRGRIYEVEV